MASTLEKLFNSRETTGDITFLVKFPSQRIRAHKCILATASDTLEDYFFGSNSRNEEITLLQVTACALNEIIRFCYLHQLKLSIDNLEEVLELAKMWQINDVFVECEAFLIKSFRTIPVSWAYCLAIENKFTRLQQLCEPEIICKAREVFADPSFLNCNRETLAKILSLRSLNCDTVDVMNACILWAKLVCRKENRDENNPQMFRSALGDLITPKLVHLMTIEDFYSLNKRYEGFFTPLECIEMTAEIMKKDANSHELSSCEEIVKSECVDDEKSVKQEPTIEMQLFLNGEYHECTAKKIPRLI